MAGVTKKAVEGAGHTGNPTGTEGQCPVVPSGEYTGHGQFPQQAVQHRCGIATRGHVRDTHPWFLWVAGHPQHVGVSEG